MKIGQSFLNFINSFEQIENRTELSIYDHPQIIRLILCLMKLIITNYYVDQYITFCLELPEYLDNIHSS